MTLEQSRLAAATLAVAALGGCTPTGPSQPFPLGAIAIEAPALYREWFERTQRCAGLSGQFDRIQWYVVPGVETFETDAGPKVGIWTRQGGREWIVIAGNYRDHQMVVRHEMLHSLLGQHGHPVQYFGTRCQLTWETWAAG